MEKSSIPAATGERRVWLRVGTLLDGSSARLFRNAHVVYDAKNFLFVGAENQPPADLLNPGQRQPDAGLPDYTLLPGLIEAHAHLFLEGGELNLDQRAAYLKQSSEELLQAAHPRLEKLVQLGITAVRDAGDKDGVGLALSRLYASAGRPLSSAPTKPAATKCLKTLPYFLESKGCKFSNFQNPML